MKDGLSPLIRRMTDWSSAIKNSSRRRDDHLLRLDGSIRELVAAWFVALFVVVAGLSLLTIDRNSAIDGTNAVANPGAHHPRADDEWNDPPCSVGPCGTSLSVQEMRFNRMQGVQNASDAVTRVYSGGSSMPALRRANGRGQDERLC